MNELPQHIIEKYDIKISKFSNHDGKENILYGLSLSNGYVGTINPTIIEKDESWEMKSKGSFITLFKNANFIHTTCF
jgi:hypothetical protein